uniref:Rapid ALkalinization Factor n=1 Tax=Nelumbo nucifera TaxID=4432 RepID=A0A822YDG5_NELNU|nr:TPA_asm: hypothetical protein HUJ06_028996 [Nelumbo nucifera]
MSTGSMRTSLKFFPVTLLLLLQLVCSSIAAAPQIGYRSKPNNGSVEECRREELTMESNISQSFIMTTVNILGANGVICNKEGRPYESCLPKPAGKYDRGCSIYNRCRQNPTGEGK